MDGVRVAAHFAACVLAVCAAHAQSLREPLRTPPPHAVHLADPFLAPRVELGRRVVWPSAWEQCERAGRMRAFQIAAGANGEHTGPKDGDADVYQLITGAARILEHGRDEALEARVDAVIELIAKAQLADGYLGTWFQVHEPARRWSDPVNGRELFCAGALCEAAALYARATGKERLLDVATRLADHVGREFGPEKRRDPDAFPGVEHGLTVLAQFTGEKRYAELARFFLEQRGRREGRTPLGANALADPLDDAPLREQTTVRGNAARALALYRGALAVAEFTQDESALPQQFEVWRDLVLHHLYVTGGVGNGAADGGFGQPFELPNESACCETCASIALAEWNRALFLVTGKTTFVELYESALYNSIPAALARDGRGYFDTNPLASRGEHARALWPARSCCALALARSLPALSDYVYASRKDALYVALYAQSNVALELGGTRVRVTQSTELPWKGHVEISVEPERPARFEVWLRIPIWAADHDIAPPPIKAGEPVEPALPRDVRTSGSWWKVLTREWKRGDRIVMNFGLEPRRRPSDPNVLANAGRVVLQSGPLVYGVESADNSGGVHTLVLKPEPEPVEITTSWRADLLGGTNVLTAKAERRRTNTNPFIAPTEPATLTAIPYALWANRGVGELAVWIASDALVANAPDESVRLARGATKLLRASSGVSAEALAALDDGVFGASSSDTHVTRATFWPRLGARDPEPGAEASPPVSAATEWFETAFRAPREVTGCTVQWSDDAGACRVPRSWRVLARVGETWREVELRTGAYRAAADERHVLTFAPLATTALRLAIALQPGYTAGVLEWQIAETAKTLPADAAPAKTQPADPVAPPK